jgi:hypothetical protein
MELRNHPGMSYRGLPNWPPVWTRAKTGLVKTTKGEVGVLKYVYSNDRLSNKCFLVVDYEKELYVGTLIFGDMALCRQMSSILKSHLGKPIKEIGDLDLSSTL